MRQNATATVEQPPWLATLNSIRDLMNSEIILGFTFAQVAKSSTNAETKARNLQNAWKAYDVVAKFLTTRDGIQSAEIAERLSVLRQQLCDLREEFEMPAKAAKPA